MRRVLARHTPATRGGAYVGKKGGVGCGERTAVRCRGRGEGRGGSGAAELHRGECSASIGARGPLGRGRKPAATKAEQGGARRRKAE